MPAAGRTSRPASSTSPSTGCVVRPPEKKGQAAAAQGGVRRVLDVTARTPVRGPQTLSFEGRARDHVDRQPGPGHRLGGRRRGGARRCCVVVRSGPQRRGGRMLRRERDRRLGPGHERRRLRHASGRTGRRRLLRMARGRRRDRHQPPGQRLRRDREGPRSVTSVTIWAPATAAAGNSSGGREGLRVAVPDEGRRLWSRSTSAPGCTSALAPYPLSRLGNGDVTSAVDLARSGLLHLEGRGPAGRPVGGRRVRLRWASPPSYSKSQA